MVGPGAVGAHGVQGGVLLQGLDVDEVDVAGLKRGFVVVAEEPDAVRVDPTAGRLQDLPDRLGVQRPVVGHPQDRQVRVRSRVGVPK